jgi:ubiquinone/menaquinone biosynthesis C-methylase UbiE
VECSRKGGGVQYSAYPKFQQLQGEETARVFDARLVDQILPLTGMVDRLKEGIGVLDIGCGEGHALNLMTKVFPKSRFYGYDISRGGIRAARAEARKMMLVNAHFKIADAARLEDRNRFDR